MPQNVFFPLLINFFCIFYGINTRIIFIYQVRHFYFKKHLTDLFPCHPNTTNFDQVNWQSVTIYCYQSPINTITVTVDFSATSVTFFFIRVRDYWRGVRGGLRLQCESLTLAEFTCNWKTPITGHICLSRSVKS